MADPSYKPTASCTNRSVSSGSSEGRSAVVKSSWRRNIQDIWKSEVKCALSALVKGDARYREDVHVTSNGQGPLSMK